MRILRRRLILFLKSQVLGKIFVIILTSKWKPMRGRECKGNQEVIENINIPKS